jgi:O-antigen/teichoic acid export membrane protein
VTLRGNILTTLTARLGLLATALISSVVLARMLGPESRGLFALALLLPDWARSLGLLGFEQANAVYAGLEPGRRRALVWHSVVVAAVVGGACALAGIAFFTLNAPGAASLLRGPLWIYLLPLSIVPARLLFEYWGAVLRGLNYIVLLNAIDLGTKVVTLAVVVIFVAWLRLDVGGAVWADALITVGGVVVLGVILKTIGAWGPPTFDRSLWRRSAGFAIPAHGGTIAAYLNYRSGELIIALLLPPEQLAFYVIAVGLAERLWILPSAVTTSLLPHLTNSRDRDPVLTAVIARHVMVWVGAGCLLVFVLAGLLIPFLYSSAFSAAIGPLRWLLPGVFALSIGKVLVTELLARERPGYTVWASGVAAVVNLASNLLLVPKFGISGAAIASTLSYALLSLILIRYYLRETGLSWTVLLPTRADLQAYVRLVSRPRPGAAAGREPAMSAKS